MYDDVDEQFESHLTLNSNFPFPFNIFCLEMMRMLRIFFTYYWRWWLNWIERFLMLVFYPNLKMRLTHRSNANYYSSPLFHMIIFWFLDNKLKIHEHKHIKQIVNNFWISIYVFLFSFIYEISFYSKDRMDRHTTFNWNGPRCDPLLL